MRSRRVKTPLWIKLVMIIFVVLVFVVAYFKIDATFDTMGKGLLTSCFDTQVKFIKKSPQCESFRKRVFELRDSGLNCGNAGLQQKFTENRDASKRSFCEL
jgi:hypothetical protein